MENKTYCPKCGVLMNAVYEKPALNLSCPKCGCKIATTVWEKIDLDQTIYSINVYKIANPSMEQIKFISKLTGKNYCQCKNLLLQGSVLFKGKAIEIKDKKKLFDDLKIAYSIEPKFKY